MKHALGHTMTMEMKIPDMTDEAAVVGEVVSAKDEVVRRGELMFVRIVL
jgi:hypothetical protein